jgi:hypothetical protein
MKGENIMGKTKQSLSSLNEYLFEQLERVTNTDLEGEALDAELKRSQAVTGLASQIVKSAGIQLNAIKHADEMGYNAVAEKATTAMLVDFEEVKE